MRLDDGWSWCTRLKDVKCLKIKVALCCCTTREGNFVIVLLQNCWRCASAGDVVLRKMSLCSSM
jgi:hypothetical protein